MTGSRYRQLKLPPLGSVMSGRPSKISVRPLVFQRKPHNTGRMVAAVYAIRSNELQRSAESNGCCALTADVLHMRRIDVALHVRNADLGAAEAR